MSSPTGKATKAARFGQLQSDFHWITDQINAPTRSRLGTRLSLDLHLVMRHMLNAYYLEFLVGRLAGQLSGRRLRSGLDCSAGINTERVHRSCSRIKAIAAANQGLVRPRRVCLIRATAQQVVARSLPRCVPSNLRERRSRDCCANQEPENHWTSCANSILLNRLLFAVAKKQSDTIFCRSIIETQIAPIGTLV